MNGQPGRRRPRDAPRIYLLSRVHARMKERQQRIFDEKGSWITMSDLVEDMLNRIDQLEGRQR